MRLSQKIFVPISILVGLLILIFLASVFILNTQKNILNSKLSEGEQINSLLNDLEQRQRIIETDVILYSSSGDQTALQSLNGADSGIDEIVDELKQFNSNPTGSQLIDRYAGARAGAKEIRQELLDAISSGKDTGLDFAKWSAKNSLTDATLNDLISFNLISLDQSASFLTSFVGKITLILLGLSISGAVIFIFLILYFRRIITRPINNLFRAADDISEKKFDIALDIKSNDELGRLGRAFNEMARNLKIYYAGLEGEIKKKEDFISIASHELKTPLTSLKIFAQSLEQLAFQHGHAEYGPYLTRINEQADKLNHLVANLLDIARLEESKIVYERKNFDLSRLIAKISNEIMAVNQTHRISIAGTSLRPVFGDEDRIAQVIVNLLTNAAKYSPGKNQIDIAVSERSSMALVAVRDYGIGIPRKYHAEIFNRFFRVSGDNQTTFSGMGVGLYISSQIIRKHGGALWVESEVGEGSTFYFTLPFAERAGNAAPF